MWHTEHTVFTTSEPEAIWRRWLDVAAWPEWDEALESASINGPLVVGSLCTIKHRAWGTQVLRVIEVQEGKSFTCAQHGFLTDIRIQHRCEPSELGSRVTHRIEAEGSLAWWLRFKLARGFRDTLPKALRKLARLAAA